MALAKGNGASSSKGRSISRLSAHAPRGRCPRWLLLALILTIAALARFYGLDWDQGYLFHPDERKIIFVVDDLGWPSDWREFFSPASPWNPRFFAYGSLPMYLLRFAASLAARINPAFETLRTFYILGRVFSALADLGTVVVLFALARTLYDDATAYLAAAFLALTVLHVQLAHFYTVDSLLTFFVTLTLYLGIRLMRHPRLALCAAIGAVFGMALATKISAAPLAVPLALAWGESFRQRLEAKCASRAFCRNTLGHFLLGGLVIAVVAVATFLVCEPYALIDRTTFLEDILQESEMARGVRDLPYTRQFIGTPPYLYLIWQTIVWSMGVPLGIVGFGGSLYMLGRLGKLASKRWWERLFREGVPFIWFALYFGIVGAFHAKFLRYMLPVIPLLCLWGARGVVDLIRASGRGMRWAGRALAVMVVGGSGLYTAAYSHIYTETHPWIQATEWICANIPKGSVLALEHWDQPLPIPQGRGAHDCWRPYRYISLDGYDPDTPAKLEALLGVLDHADYIVLASNRLYNSIPRLPERYPLMTRFYELLLREELGFELVYFAQVYPQLAGVRLVDDTFHDPNLPMPRLLREEGRRPGDLILGRADESYSVYDHPMPLVFRRVERLSREELLERFGQAVKRLQTTEDMP